MTRIKVSRCSILTRMTASAIFTRSLAVPSAPHVASVANASRTTADGTFAVASRVDGVIQVYAASCAALLHEFATLHAHVHALHYTSFSDSLVTLESNAHSGAVNDPSHADDEETFLCVYHDWRERNMVRAYTLPLGVLETPPSGRKADCVAVCSYSGRVVVAMGSVVNMWQCSRGFFEHVLELRVDMAQHDAYHILEHVAIHGVYVAFGSSTEVRVVEVHVQSSSEVSTLAPSDGVAPGSVPVSSASTLVDSSTPEDDSSCIHFGTTSSTVDSIAIPLASYGEIGHVQDHLSLVESAFASELEEVPLVFGKDISQQEAHVLAGLIRGQDVRVNQAMNYFVPANGIRTILRRFLPPNQRIQTLKFLPETIDNQTALEARSYTRLLVGTSHHAFVYYFLSSEADVTRQRMKKKMNKRTLQRAHTFEDRGGSSPPLFRSRADSNSGTGDLDNESTRVVMHYSFSGPVSCITANSSFLFVTSASCLEVWSIWSPCYELASSRVSGGRITKEPPQPQLVSVVRLGQATIDITAMDSCVIVSTGHASRGQNSSDAVGWSNGSVTDLLPRYEFEIRGEQGNSSSLPSTGLLILHQCPASSMLSLVQSHRRLNDQARVDMLSSLFSLYRYRANVGSTTVAKRALTSTSTGDTDARELVGLKIETAMYDRLACDCASALATALLNNEPQDLKRAVAFFVESRLAPTKVLAILHQVRDSSKIPDKHEQLNHAIHEYIFDCSFKSKAQPEQSTQHQVQRVAFTRTAVDHFAKNAPQQLTELVIDSTLVWTVEDLEYAYALVRQREETDSVRGAIAQLVLILRAQSLKEEQWVSAKANNPAAVSRMESTCSSVALTAAVQSVISRQPKALVALCVANRQLLAKSRFPTHFGGVGASSLFAATLVAEAPNLLIDILQGIFNDCVSRREPLLGTIELCVSAIANTFATRCSNRLATAFEAQDLHSITSGDTVRVGTMVLMHVLCFCLDSFPRLHALAERDEINETEDELFAVHRLLSTELVRLSVEFTSATIPGDDAALVEVITTLGSDWAASGDGKRIPEWEVQYVNSRCVPPHIRQGVLGAVMANLLQRVLSMVHGPSMALDPLQLLTWCPAKSPVNDFGFLLTLLTLASVHRTIDALHLLTDRQGFLDVLLPFGKSHCATLEEWRFLIQTLSTSSDTPTATQSSSTGLDELGVLENILHHVCTTLGPEDLLQVLPDDGDLALFMATIEASVRLEDARMLASVA